jgi:rod shape-determining protein MreC
MRWPWLTRTRGLAVAVGIAFLLILFSPQIQRRPLLLVEQPLLLFESWVQRTVGSLTGWGGRVTEQYVALGDQREDNQRLRDEVARLRGEVTALEERLGEAARHERLQAFGREAGLGTTVARVIGRDPTNWYQSVLIDRGERDGVVADMGVVVPDGVVGRVIKVMPRTAVVLLVSDRNSVVPGLTQRSRDEGLIEGVGAGRLRMKYLSTLADVQAGDSVVTSGLTAEFPKGLRIGTVTAVEQSPDAISQSAFLEPAVDLSRLEEVVLLPLAVPDRS